MYLYVTRDAKSGDDPDVLFLHTTRPVLEYDGTWTSELGAITIPDVKPGKRRCVVLPLCQLKPATAKRRRARGD